MPFARFKALLGPIAEKAKRFQPPRDHTERGQREALSYYRAKAISVLISEVSSAFMKREPDLISPEQGGPLSRAIPSAEPLKAILADTRRLCYEAPSVLQIELAGYEILSFMLDRFVPAMLSERPSTQDRKLIQLMLGQEPRPETRSEANSETGSEPKPEEALHQVTDFLSAMTDAEALSLYRRLRGIALPTT